jgi:transposase-like protein
MFNLELKKHTQKIARILPGDKYLEIKCPQCEDDIYPIITGFFKKKVSFCCEKCKKEVLLFTEPKIKYF